MAQQAPSIQAVLTQGVDRATFLQQTDRAGFNNSRAGLGLHEIKHSVLVFGEGNGVDDEHTVVMTLSERGFSVQEYLTTAEARTLAQALLLAADYVDAGQHMLSASQRHEAQQQADEVAA